MQILLVVTKAEIGGAQKRIIDLASSYQAAGHDVTVASGPGEYLPAELEELSIEHVTFKYLSRANPAKIIAYIFELWRFLGRRDFDVVHLNSSSALAGALACKARLTRPKTVFTFRGLSMLAPGFRASKLKKWFYRLSFKTFLPFVDMGVFQCEANQRTADKLGLKAKEERVIMDGINMDRINFLPRDEAREQLAELTGISLEGKQVVGSIGRLSYQKHYAFLVRQMRKLQKHREDTVCIIIGDGPKRDKLESLIRKLGLEETVFLVGKRANAAELLAGFDVFTLVSRYEGLSMTLTEALHAGVPLLVSDVGCAREVVADERLVFSLGNAVEFLAKLRGLLDTEDREAITGNIQARAEDLVLERSAEEYLDLYKNQLNLAEEVKQESTLKNFRDQNGEDHTPDSVKRDEADK